MPKRNNRLLTLRKEVSAFCGLVSEVNGDSQTIGTSFVKINQFTAVSADTRSVTASAVDDEVTINSKGVYIVAYTTSFSGSVNTLYTVSAFIKGVEQPTISFQRKLQSQDVGDASFFGFFGLNVGDIIDVRVKTDGESNDFKVERSQLAVIRIGFLG